MKLKQIYLTNRSHVRGTFLKNENDMYFPSPLMGEGTGEGDSRVPPHLNPLPRRGGIFGVILFFGVYAMRSALCDFLIIPVVIPYCSQAVIGTIRPPEGNTATRASG